MSCAHLRRKASGVAPSWAAARSSGLGQAACPRFTAARARLDNDESRVLPAPAHDIEAEPQLIVDGKTLARGGEPWALTQQATQQLHPLGRLQMSEERGR